jgi:hypothetical protein
MNHLCGRSYYEFRKPAPLKLNKIMKKCEICKEKYSLDNFKIIHWDKIEYCKICIECRNKIN